VSVSAKVPEKSRGNKKCDDEEEERHIFGLFGIAVKWPRHGCMQLYVRSVKDSTLMPILYQFCFSFVFFWGYQKWALIAIFKTSLLLVASLLILGCDVTASSSRGCCVYMANDVY